MFSENFLVTAKLLGSNESVTGYVIKNNGGRTFIVKVEPHLICHAENPFNEKPYCRLTCRAFEVDESTILKIN